jgi:dihydrofolate reductase/thymidylate synthase
VKIDNLSFNTYQRKKYFGEIGYLNLMNKILNEGVENMTRNAITLSTFGETLEFDLTLGFPLLTTKKMYWRGIVEELLWFIRGDTNSKILENKKVNIWRANTTREFLNNRGLIHYEEGDIGPMYGFQWRNYGVDYNGMNHEYHGGYDQLKNCLELIINDPTSRRILMTTFNPAVVKDSVLAPCHGIKVQFNVSNNKLDLQMDMRSSDVFLGLPYNITSYAILLELISKLTNYQSGKLIMTLGNTHIYNDHIKACKTQLQRIPYYLPKLNIKKKYYGNSVDDMLNYLETLQYEDFEIKNYNYHPTIKAQMIA